MLSSLNLIKIVFGTEFEFHFPFMPGFCAVNRSGMYHGNKHNSIVWLKKIVWLAKVTFVLFHIHRQTHTHTQNWCTEKWASNAFRMIIHIPFRFSSTWNMCPVLTSPHHKLTISRAKEWLSLLNRCWMFEAKAIGFNNYIPRSVLYNVWTRLDFEPHW